MPDAYTVRYCVDCGRLVLYRDGLFYYPEHGDLYQGAYVACRECPGCGRRLSSTNDTRPRPKANHKPGAWL